MASQSEQLEQQSRQTRARISETVDTLRDRMTAGQVIDQIADYAQYGPVAEFLRNLGREVRDNPLPVALIVTGVAWLMIASSLSSRARREVYIVERDAGPARRSMGFEDDEGQAAIRADDGEVDWSTSRTPTATAMERADEG
jgi:hypothetical protein